MSRLADAVRRFGELTVVVAGDVMLDENVWGTCRRLSPEAPVPVVDVERFDLALGGAGNAAANAVALGASRTMLVAAVGDDDAGRSIASRCRAIGVEPHLVIDGQARTTRKCRVYAADRQVARYDVEGPAVSPSAQRSLLDQALELLDIANVVVVSDYDKGAWSDRALGAIVTAAEGREAITVVDTKRRSPAAFRGCTALTPNAFEFQRWEPAFDPNDEAPPDKRRARVVEALVAGGWTQALLLTQGRDGMTLYDRRGAVHLAARSSSAVDPTGAGDAVATAFALSLASGLSLLDAATVANIAAGIAVHVAGTAPVTASDVLLALQGVDDLVPEVVARGTSRRAPAG